MAPQTRPQVAWDDPRPTVSILKACELVGVSRRTIYNWLYAGRLDWRRTAGGAVRIVAATLWEQPTAQAHREAQPEFTQAAATTAGGHR